MTDQRGADAADDNLRLRAALVGLAFERKSSGDLCWCGQTGAQEHWPECLAARAALAASAPDEGPRKPTLDEVYESYGVTFAASAPDERGLWDDVVKFVRWSANVRDDTAEAIAVARKLLRRIESARPAAAPALDVEVVRLMFHDRNEREYEATGCRHRNQHRSSWECAREADEFAAEYARQKEPTGGD